MKRKEKYRLLRWKKRLEKVRVFILATLVFSLMLFAFGLYSVGSLAYFNATYSVHLGAKNAVKEELVVITVKDLIYEEQCIAKQPVTIKNIFDYVVKISIEGTNYVLEPGEVVTHNQIVASNCGDFGKHTIKIIGYENYFDHIITVNVEKDKLNPCPPASDNGQGKPNDNGEGKKCGHNEERKSTEEDESKTPIESLKDEDEEIVKEEVGDKQENIDSSNSEEEREEKVNSQDNDLPNQSEENSIHPGEQPEDVNPTSSEADPKKEQSILDTGEDEPKDEEIEDPSTEKGEPDGSKENQSP
jgi:hypothetical protein